MLPLLSPELWNHVFGFLSAADKFSVRTCCRYFRKLVDHWSLWRGWTVVLTFPRSGPYNALFWASLRRRRLSSVVVRRGRAEDLKQLVNGLPSLTTLFLDRSCQKSLGCLKDFPRLKRLLVRRSFTSLPLDAFTVNEPQQLMHLSLCDVNFPTSKLEDFTGALSRFTNLSSLVCHHTGIFEDTAVMVHSILSCLPRLKHLSLSAVNRPYRTTRGAITDPSHGKAPALSSLEFIDCVDQSLSENLMKLVPGLKSLSVFYKPLHQEHLDEQPLSPCHLRAWLSDLPQLTTLVVVTGPPVQHYLTSIPATVTSLTLCDSGFSSQDLPAIAAQVPHLCHLHIDPGPSHLGISVAQIPRLFPKLKRLKLRHEHVPESKLLDLHRLQDLKYLEILDSRPHLSKLAEKLRVLTNYRLRVVTSPGERAVVSCCN